MRNWEFLFLAARLMRRAYHPPSLCLSFPSHLLFVLLGLGHLLLWVCTASGAEGPLSLSGLVRCHKGLYGAPQNKTPWYRLGGSLQCLEPRRGCGLSRGGGEYCVQHSVGLHLGQGAELLWGCSERK
ncbi:unnamed protein product [Lepidochelys kempii]